MKNVADLADLAGLADMCPTMVLASNKTNRNRYSYLSYVCPTAHAFFFRKIIFFVNGTNVWLNQFWEFIMLFYL